MDFSPLQDIFTGESKYLAGWQVGVRTVLAYAGALLLVRAGEQRMFGKNTAMDVLMGVVLGSVISRGINGSSTLAESLGASLLLIVLHMISAKLAFRSEKFGNLVKGTPCLLVKDGVRQEKQMKHTDVTDNDLYEALRTHGHSEKIEKIAESRLERNGAISLIMKKPEPKVIEITVAEGVQTVRIEVG